MESSREQRVPADAVFRSPPEMVRAFAGYGCEIVGLPPGE